MKMKQFFISFGKVLVWIVIVSIFAALATTTSSVMLEWFAGIMAFLMSFGLLHQLLKELGYYEH